AVSSVPSFCVRMCVLRIGFFENFKGEDSILFAGDVEGMLLLSKLLADLSAERMQQIIFDDVPSAEVQFGLSIPAKCSRRSLGVRRTGVRFPSQSASFEWVLSAEDWEDVRERIKVLEDGALGHQYPDDYLGVIDDVHVIISVNEYGDSLWESQTLSMG